MGVYLNPGNEKFAKAVQSEIYVDKTGLIEYTNQVINTVQRYVCVSRPRRFGKSMTADIKVRKLNDANKGMAIYDGGYADGLLWEGMRFQRTFFWIENFSKCCICTALKSISYDFFEYAGISEPEQGNWPGD